jgi:hypothetical protein
MKSDKKESRSGALTGSRYRQQKLTKERLSTASSLDDVLGTCAMLYGNVATIEQLRVSPRVIALTERLRRVPGSRTRKPLSEDYADAYHYIYFVYGRPKKSSGSIEVFYDNSHALTAVNPGPIDDPRTQEVA